MKTWLRGLAFALPLFSVFTVGCGSSSGSSPSSSTSGDTFTDVYTNVFVPNGCTSHHDGSSAEGSLDLRTQTSAYTALVGVKAAGASCGSSGLTRVVKSDASTSLLFLKVSEATPPCGSQMPMGGTPISTADMTTIKDWINAGAPNN